MEAFCGVCDRDAGDTLRIAFPDISPSTRLGPERWVWTLGVCAVAGGCMLPAAPAVQKVLQRAQERHGARRRFLYDAVFSMLVAGLVGLVVEACVPLQEDILVNKRLTRQSEIHLFAAGILFTSLLMQGLLVLCLQACAWWSSRATFTPRSLGLKALMAGFVALTILPVIPVMLLVACPRGVCDPCACQYNASGLAQRCLVAGLALYCATYGPDIAALRRGEAEAEAAGSAAAGLGLVGAESELPARGLPLAAEASQRSLDI